MAKQVGVHPPSTVSK